MKTTEIAALFMLIAVVSFLGFVVENIWLWGTKGYIDNRNMCLPFLIGYGLAIVAIHALFGTPSQLILLGKRLGIRNKIVKKCFIFSWCLSVSAWVKSYLERWWKRPVIFIGGIIQNFPCISHAIHPFPQVQPSQ